MLQIRQLDHVVLRVTNLQAMMHFYVDVLGCKVEKVQEKIGLWQLRAGAALIDLVPIDGPAGQKGGAAPGREGRNMDHFCLQVEPFDGESIIAHLKQQGCEPGPGGVPVWCERAGAVDLRARSRGQYGGAERSALGDLSRASAGHVAGRSAGRKPSNSAKRSA